MGDWISIEKLLPEPGRYLTACETDEGREVLTLFWGGAYWTMCDEPLYSLPYYIEVTHWMALPEFPTKGDNNANS